MFKPSYTIPFAALRPLQEIGAGLSVAVCGTIELLQQEASVGNLNGCKARTAVAGYKKMTKYMNSPSSVGLAYQHASRFRTWYV